jgi:hypothetical protein
MKTKGRLPKNMHKDNYRKAQEYNRVCKRHGEREREKDKGGQESQSSGDVG